MSRAALPPASRYVFQSPRLAFGCFRCPPSYPDWRRVNSIGGSPLVVFPRVPVRIGYGRHDAVVADAARVMLYNHEDQYTREVLCERGDECEWLAVEPALLHEAVAEFDPQVGDDPRRPFRRRHGRGDGAAYFAQRRLFNAVESEAGADRLWVEEQFFGVLRRTLAGIYEARPAGAAERAATRIARDEAAEFIRATLARDFARPWSLEEVAALVSLSPYHVCRLFRGRSGFSIHAYLTRLRLCFALEELDRPGVSLTALALAAGFSSHAHFTTAFRAAFGVSPSQVRSSPVARRRATRRAARMSTNLKA